MRVRFLCAPDEESEDIDTRSTDEMVRQGFVGDFAITGEPTELHVGIQAKGVLACRIVVSGRAAHGSTPWLGDNAVLKAIDVFRRIETLPFSRESSELFDRPSINLGRINGGDALNKVPDECTMVVDIRYLPNQDPGDILEQIRTIPDIEIPRTFIRKPAYVSRSNPYVMALCDVAARLTSGESLSVGRDGASDAGSFLEAGVPGRRVRPRAAPATTAPTSGSRCCRCRATGRRSATSSSTCPRASSARRASCAPSRGACVNPQEPVPNVGRSLLKRGALAGLVIVLLAAGSVSAAGFLQADSIINTIEKEGRAPIDIPEIDRAQAGEAQTLMILGSDQRYGDKKLGLKPRSDTIILVRLDPDKEATAVMSVPRDLKVEIPGHGTDKINAAYELGGPRLTVKTVKKLFAKPGQPFKINHVVNVELRRLPQGRQLHRRRLRRHRPPLLQRQHAAARTTRRSTSTPATRSSRGRTRSTTSATATATTTSCARARQQDFLRQLRNAAGARRLLNYSRRTELARLFARYTDTDKGLRQKKDVFSLLKLVLFTGQKPVREVRFRVDLNNDPVYLTASQAKLDKTADEFLQREGVEEAAPDLARLGEPTASRPRRARASATSAPTCPGSRSRAARARTRRSSAPAARASRSTSRRCATAARATPAPSRGSTTSRTSAARSTAPTGSWSPRASIGEYYGIQGMTWREPPILDDPSEIRQGQRPQARAALRRQPAAARGVADEARRLLGLQHADPVAEQATRCSGSRRPCDGSARSSAPLGSGPSR